MLMGAILAGCTTGRLEEPYLTLLSAIFPAFSLP